jgi:triacylglycerol lipase
MAAELVDKRNKLTYCDTQYPVLLVSGMGLKDHHKLYNYWGTIPDVLKEYGAAAFTAKQFAFTSHYDNAMALKYRTFEVLEKTKKDKINIIAHSKGGIEARYMISNLDMGEHVASLTTLGTPHRGTPLADIVVGKIPVGQFVLARLVNIYARVMGDSDPDSLRATLGVTSEGMAQFNREVLDHPNVYYQSYAGHVNKEHSNMLLKTLATILYQFSGKNDGIVPIESAKWGDYKGIIADENCPSVSHADMVGVTRFFGGTSKFNHNLYFVKMVHELKEMGF